MGREKQNKEIVRTGRYNKGFPTKPVEPLVVSTKTKKKKSTGKNEDDGTNLWHH